MDKDQADRIEWLLRDIYDRMGWSIEAALTLQRAKARDEAEQRQFEETRQRLKKDEIQRIRDRLPVGINPTDAAIDALYWRNLRRSQS